MSPPMRRTVVVYFDDDRLWQSLSAGFLSILHTRIEHLVIASFNSLTPRADYPYPLVKLTGRIVAHWPIDAVIVSGGSERESALQQKFACLHSQYQTLITSLTDVQDDLLGWLSTLEAHQLLLPDYKQSSKVDVEQRSSLPWCVMFWKQNDTGLYGRRSEMLARYLATRDDLAGVLLVDEPIKEETLLAHRAHSPGSYQSRVYKQTVGRALSFYESDPEKTATPRFISYIRSRYDAGLKAYTRFLQHQFVLSGVTPAHALFVVYPKLQYGAQALQHFKPRLCVADIVDDHRTWPGLSAERIEQLNKHYAEVIDQADYLITNCESVKKSMQEFVNGKLISMLPNAADADAPANKGGENTYWLNKIKSYKRVYKGPVLGYVSNLESKVDIELLTRVCDEVEGVILVLVGSTHASSAEIDELLAKANVIHTGILPYTEAGAVIQYFDIGLLPHRQTGLTQHMNPLKVFTYLSYAKPVIATQVPNLPAFDYVYTVKSHAEFVEAINRVFTALESGSIATSKFEEFVQHNSWQARFSKYFGRIIRAHLS